VVSERSTDVESTVGVVFGIAITWQKPPAAAAAVPVSMFSLYSWPGVRRCTWGSVKAGNRCLPCASITAVSAGGCSAPGAEISAIEPSRISTSWLPLIPLRGSRTSAPVISSCAGAAVE
jgi:hypothetical protein